MSFSLLEGLSSAYSASLMSLIDITARLADPTEPTMNFGFGTCRLSKGARTSQQIQGKAYERSRNWIWNRHLRSWTPYAIKMVGNFHETWKSNQCTQMSGPPSSTLPLYLIDGFLKEQL